MNQQHKTEAYRIFLLAYTPGIDAKTFRQNIMSVARERRDGNPVALSLVFETPHASNAELAVILERTAAIYEVLRNNAQLVDGLMKDKGGNA